MFFEGEKLKQIKLACWVDYASYFYEKKDFRGAIESYKKALVLDPTDYYANIGLACTLVANKSFEESCFILQSSRAGWVIFHATDLKSLKISGS